MSDDACCEGHVCMVCLEGGADRAPPCGGSSISAFHGRCLYEAECARRHAPFLCPHCNVEVRRGAGGDAAGELAWDVRDRVWHALAPWLEQPGHWITAAVYVLARHHALVRGDEEARMDSALDDEVFAALRGGGCVGVGCTTEGPRRVYRCISKADDTEETAVFAWRTAHVGDQGRILCDGYTMRATRFRRTPRLRREAHHIMSAEP